jgi:hypothetical protein
MQAAAIHVLPVAWTGPIPESMVRDLLVAVLLTEERPSARSRLESALGSDFAQGLVKTLLGSRRSDLPR